MITDAQRTELKAKIDTLAIAYCVLIRQTGKWANSQSEIDKDFLTALAKECDKTQREINQWIDKEL